jgi:hypothetical protein
LFALSFLCISLISIFLFYMHIYLLPASKNCYFHFSMHTRTQVERLAAHKLRVCRVGHPARLLPDVVRHSLDALVRAHDQAGIGTDIRADMNRRVRVRARGMQRLNPLFGLSPFSSEFLTPFPPACASGTKHLHT